MTSLITMLSCNTSFAPASKFTRSNVISEGHEGRRGDDDQKKDTQLKQRNAQILNARVRFVLLVVNEPKN